MQFLPACTCLMSLGRSLCAVGSVIGIAALTATTFVAVSYAEVKR